MTGIAFGTAQWFRDVAAPFVGELLADASERSYATEINEDASAGRGQRAVIPVTPPAVAHSTQELIVGFLAVVVAGGISSGVTGAIGADLYTGLLKRPLANLLTRIRKSPTVDPLAVTFVSEVWFDEVLVQIRLRLPAMDAHTQVPALLTQALNVAGRYVDQSRDPPWRSF